MAAPVINTTQSVLGYRQWQTFAFQPWASNSPTFWNLSPLPPGLTLHLPTGKISGAATMPGVFVVSLIAGNADGASDPVIFTFGIEPSGNVRPSGVLEVYIDLLTKLVSLNAGNFGDANTKDKGPLFWTKRGDDLVFHITFLKGGVVADIDLAALRFALKELEPESILVDGHDWRKVGEGEQTAFRLHVKLDSPELTSFVQFDSDVLLFKPLPKRLIRERLIAQSPDFPHYYSSRDMRAAQEIAGFAPGGTSYNAGLLGGSDVALVRAYAWAGLDLAQKFRGSALNGTTTSMIVEQYQLGVFSRRVGVEVGTLLPLAPTRKQVAKAGYAHLTGGAKREDKWIAKAEARLAADFPAAYERFVAAWPQLASSANGGVEESPNESASLVAAAF